MLNYVYQEIKYGGNLYISGWKKLLLHPWQTVKDIGSALYHPIRTLKGLWGEAKQHPIGMMVNIGLSWATGRTIGEGIEFGINYYSSVSNTASSILQNSSEISKNATLSLQNPSAGRMSFPFSQIFQASNLGGCGCGNICTVSQVGQTTSMVANQTERSTTAIHQTTKEKCCKNNGCSATEKKWDKTTSIHSIDTQQMLVPEEREQENYSNFVPGFNNFRREVVPLSSISVTENLSETKNSQGYELSSQTVAKKTSWQWA